MQRRYGSLIATLRQIFYMKEKDCQLLGDI